MTRRQADRQTLRQMDSHRLERGKRNHLCCGSLHSVTSVIFCSSTLQYLLHSHWLFILDLH